MTPTKRPLFIRKTWWAALALAGAACGCAFASPVLIVRSDLAGDVATAQAVANLSALQTSAGNTVTVVTAMPAALAGYSQVWDLAFRGGSLSTDSQSAYLGYLQQGGRLMLIGENDQIFAARNQGIRDFIAAAGGGAVGAQNGSGALYQTLRAPFNGPEPVSTPFPLLGPAYFDNRGTGAWLLAAESDDLGSGLAFDAGDLVNAGAGTLLSVLDVDFLGNLDQGFGAQTRAMASNLVSYMTHGATTQVPEPPALALVGLALAAASLGTRRRAGAAPPH